MAWDKTTSWAFVRPPRRSGTNAHLRLEGQDAAAALCDGPIACGKRVAAVRWRPRPGSPGRGASRGAFRRPEAMTLRGMFSKRHKGPFGGLEGSIDVYPTASLGLSGTSGLLRTAMCSKLNDLDVRLWMPHEPALDVRLRWRRDSSPLFSVRCHGVLRCCTVAGRRSCVLPARPSALSTWHRTALSWISSSCHLSSGVGVFDLVTRSIDPVTRKACWRHDGLHFDDRLIPC
jgi:hypothetical protein